LEPVLVDTSVEVLLEDTMVEWVAVLLVDTTVAWAVELVEDS
jgi:hypothetical protein